MPRPDWLCVRTRLFVCVRVLIYTQAHVPGGRSVHARNMENATWMMQRGTCRRRQMHEHMLHRNPLRTMDAAEATLFFVPVYPVSYCLYLRPHRHRDWAHPAHICAGIGTTPLRTACTPTAQRIERSHLRARTNRNLNIHGTSCHPYWHQRRERQRCMLRVVRMLHVLRCLLHLGEWQARVVALQARP